MNESAKAVHRFYEALERGDPDAATEYLTEDFVLEDAALGRADGRREATERWHTLLSAFPDVSFRVEREFVSGETVVQEQVVEGHHKGPFLEIPPTGARVRFRAAVVAECRQGRVAVLRLYRDVSAFMAQFAIIVHTAVVAAILNRALPIALIVGTTFTLINQLPKMLAGTMNGIDWIRMATNYAVPFTVSTVSALTFRRPGPGTVPRGPFGRLLKRRIRRKMLEEVQR
jgi:steroid delta-isomerase-like uncharacterized protein